MPFPHNLRVELSPRRIEEELKAYLHRWFDQTSRTHVYKMDWLAQEALEHVVSRSFLAGKIAASRETRTPWQIIGDDGQLIEDLSLQFKADFEKTMQDLRLDVIVDGPPISRKDLWKRLDALSQMLTWKVYNQGKISEFNHSINQREKRQSRYSADAARKYDQQFMVFTEADDRVCDECAPYAGLIVTDFNEILALFGGDYPPWHFNCRCQIVASPLFKDVQSQERFRELTMEELQIEQAVT